MTAAPPPSHVPRRAVIFDLDGTLVDSNYLHTLAWARALRACGEWAPMNAVHRLIGMGADQLLPRLIGRRDEAIAARRADEYDALIDEVVAFPGAAQLLGAVRERGMLVVLATSSPPAEYERMIELLGVGGLVDAHTTIDDVGRSKPDPEIFHRAVQLAGVEPAAAIVVGDSRWDVEAAIAAGLECVAVESGGFGRAELLAAGAVQVVRDAAELADGLPHSAICDVAAGARSTGAAAPGRDQPPREPLGDGA